jgi:hypothetical protein
VNEFSYNNNIIQTVSTYYYFIFKRELIWNEWFIFIFIDIYNN